MWTCVRNSPARNARERETRSKTGRWIFGEAFRVPAAEKGTGRGRRRRSAGQQRARATARRQARKEAGRGRSPKVTGRRVTARAPKADGGGLRLGGEQGRRPTAPWPSPVSRL